jgi:hypothetical protein
MNREPIFWTTTAKDYNKSDRERVSFNNGKRIVEKVPQIGHVGDYENKIKAKGQRYVYVVRNEGHVVPLLLTNAAAHMDPNTPFGQYQRNKARALGWYPAGGCPCALALAGEFHYDQFRTAAQLRKSSPCKPGSHSYKDACDHDLAERAARAKEWNAEESERMASFKPAADRYHEETQKQNAELLGVIRDLIKGGIHAEPEDKPKK